MDAVDNDIMTLILVVLFLGLLLAMGAYKLLAAELARRLEEKEKEEGGL